MARTPFRRAHAGVLAGLVVAALFALVVPINASETGVTPAQGCTCHNDQPDPLVSVAVSGWPDVYTPAADYPLTVAATGPVPGSKGGFTVEVSKGSLSSADPAVVASGPLATHTSSAVRSWPLLWRAPPEDSGGVTLVVYVNLVDGDGNDGPEDLWNVLTLTATEKAPEPPKPSTLELAFTSPDGVLAAGRNFTTVATLENFEGAPVPNATVRFAAHLTFGILRLGSAKTDVEGQARINWTVPAEGLYLLFAHYDGSSKNQSSNASATASVADPDGVFVKLYGHPSSNVAGLFDPVRIPLGLVVGGVWVTFAYAGLLVLRVRKQGAPADDGLRALLRLLVPQFGRPGRKKP